MSDAAARDTIFALSSGSPPAAIAVIRISGPRADEALLAITGKRTEPRRASIARFLSPATGDLIDEGLVVRFPGPASATGEDLVELHGHGGRAIVAALLAALASIDGLRAAEPGEFTRRAFENGRIDLAEAEGLADLLEAETETQRRSALALAGGALSRRVEGWQRQLLQLAAQVEAALDFADEEDVDAVLSLQWQGEREAVAEDIGGWLARPSSERLKDGIRIVIAGPPNAGKSSLFNILSGREAAITSPVEGTTRDIVEAPTAISGVPFLLQDTAGLRDSGDGIERIGVARAMESLAAADIVVWLGAAAEAPERALVVQSKIDLDPPSAAADVRVSAQTGMGIDRLIELIVCRGRRLLPQADEVAINRRQRALLDQAWQRLAEAASSDLLIVAESLRLARVSLDRITGRAGVEDMLDALFGRFCIGK